MRRFFRNYQELIKSNSFTKFEKELSNLLDTELSKNLKEVETVKNWITKLNGKNFTYNGLKTNINSLFIHGYNHSEKGSYPSGVEFDYYDNIYKRELADIIFISSFYYRGKKVLEKVTFNQAKWGDVKSTTSSWKIDQGQLYLLSRLPRFNGVNGSIISNKDYYINNISKCLTSYGLMNKENFVFISTNYLLTAMGGKKSINLKDFQNLNNLEQNMHLGIPFLNDDFLYHEFFYFLEKYCRKSDCCLNTFNKLFNNSSIHFTNNTFEFVSKYLKGNIGEIIHNDITKTQNDEVKNLILDIVKNINTFASQTKNKEAQAFILNYNNSNNVGINDNIELKEFENSLGIIQIKVDLGE